MDARRLANRRGLTVRGPQKLFDSSLAAIGMLHAERHGVFRKYNDLVFERFWKRALDIENREVIRAVLAEAGAPVESFFDFLDGEGRVAHDRICRPGRGKRRVRRANLRGRRRDFLGRRPALDGAREAWRPDDGAVIIFGATITGRSRGRAAPARNLPPRRQTTRAQRASRGARRKVSGTEGSHIRQGDRRDADRQPAHGAQRAQPRRAGGPRAGAARSASRSRRARADRHRRGRSRFRRRRRYRRDGRDGARSRDWSSPAWAIA